MKKAVAWMHETFDDDTVSLGWIPVAVALSSRDRALVYADEAGNNPPDLGARYRVEFDGFIGTVIGAYTRLDGEEGVVMQQDGTKVVHVYRRKWLIPQG